MKKLLKSEICRSGNSAWDPHVAENWLKGQTFRLKKKKAETQTCVWEAQNTLPFVLPKCTLSVTFLVHKIGPKIKRLVPTRQNYRTKERKLDHFRFRVTC